MKTCTKCGLLVPLDHYYVSNGRMSTWCKGCHAEQGRKRRLRGANVTPEVREKTWAANIRRKFKMEPEQYAEMLAGQGGVCAICKGPDKRGRRLSVDHDHGCCPTSSAQNRVLTCGECVRGLICTDCNTMIGLAYEREDVLLNAIGYLRRYERKMS